MNKGFTLIELLVVVLIIGIMSAVALPQYTTAVEKARATEALTLMSAIRQSAERYQLQKDVWPTSNNFSVLDIEVPKVPGSTTQYGGKNFTITMAPTGGNKYFVINALRNITKGKYALKTVLTVETDGTISAKRFCGTNTGLGIGYSAPTGDAEKFCSAITSGHNDNF